MVCSSWRHGPRLGGVLVLLVLAPCWAWAGRLKDFRFLSKNVTSTLDKLLAAGHYDKRIRPDLGGPPTLVTVSIYIKSMSSVSETEQKYSMDTYFRQSWYDHRLRFSLPGLNEFSMSWLFLERVWKPDTFILNGHRSYLHRITVPNKFLRVRSDGFMTYSMRLTLQASCTMHLRKFPLDSQRCPLVIGSYGYTSSDLVYAWHPTGVGLERGVELAQYELVNISTVPAQRILRGTEEYSVIHATFDLRRNTGYYTLQVFVPCGLIVCSSWVSFWIDPDAVPARVSLAVTTVLSMTTMGFGGRASMPRVNYATALDWFVILCFAFVFAVMIEYAAINFIDKVTVDLRRLLEERKKKKTSNAGVTAETPEDGARRRSGASKDTIGLVARALRRRRQLQEDSAGPSPSSKSPSVVVTVDSPWEAMDPNQQHSPVEDEIVYADVQMQNEHEGQLASPECLARITGAENSSRAAGDLLEIPIEASGTSLRRSPSLRRCLSAPYRLWEQTKILPSEEDVSRQMQSEDEPEKFSKIDIISRKVFPIAFGSSLLFYWVLYGYYITDKFSEEEDKDFKFEISPGSQK